MTKAKKQYRLDEMCYKNEELQKLIQAARDESVAEWSAWGEVPGEQVANNPLVIHAGNYADCTYHAVWYGDELVGYIGYETENNTKIFNIDDFFIKESHQTPTKMKQIIDLMTPLAHVRGNCRIKIDIYHSPKRAALMTRLKAEQFISTYSFKVPKEGGAE